MVWETKIRWTRSGDDYRSTNYLIEKSPDGGYDITYLYQYKESKHFYQLREAKAECERDYMRSRV